MADLFEEIDQTDESKWHNNKEMNPVVNSSVTDEGLTDPDTEGDTSWRDEDVNEQSGDPGRTPGSAEGEDDAAYTGQP